ncbi:hypothetical protein GCM10009864_57140 [Streptomyces lunalinharesii]|uniref:Uncharacterized protein n=1 Tax=Streptomyces lunalinharesii TaxID=333384 RepID=A0ABN3SI73_9ACTN
MTSRDGLGLDEHHAQHACGRPSLKSREPQDLTVSVSHHGPPPRDLPHVHGEFVVARVQHAVAGAHTWLAASVAGPAPHNDSAADTRHSPTTLLTAAGPRTTMEILAHSQRAIPMNTYATSSRTRSARQ